MPKIPLIAVVGPTASGKSAWGEALTLALNGEIISADSRQVYRGFDLCSGKDALRVPQQLIDICDPEEPFTVADWVQLAQAQIAKLRTAGRQPILVGGTGLYISALIEGYAFGPEPSAAERVAISQESTDELVSYLQTNNSAALEGLDQRNRRYLERAVEKTRHGWVSSEKRESAYEVLLIGRELPRAELYRRIDARVEDRLQAGMLAEVQGLLDRGVSSKWLRSLGLEGRYLVDYLEGRYSSLEEMTTKLKFATHHFARRQLTWWRRYPVLWVETEAEAFAAAQKFLTTG